MEKPGIKKNPKCSPERAGISPFKGAISASQAARQEQHLDVADFLESRS